MNANIAEILLRNAEGFAEKPALIHGDTIVSYRQLADDVQRRAAWLHHHGVRKGARVLLFVPMSIELYRTLIALFYIGATAVFVDAWAGIARIDAACRAASPDAFIGIWRAHLLRLASRELRRIPLKLIAPPRLSTSTTASVPIADVIADHPALITFTTGSTGTPKAAVRTHGFLLAQHRAIVSAFDASSDDVDMPLLPIFTLSNLAIGATTVLPRVDGRRVERFDPKVVIEDIRQHNVATTTGSPAFYERLAGHCLDHDIRLDTLKRIITGGAPVFPALARRLRRAFPDTRVTVAYGSTEAEPISLIDATELIETSENMMGDGLPAGRPVSFIEVRIIDIREGPITVDSREEFEALSLPTGEVGEICVCGDHVLRDYLGNGTEWNESKIRVDDMVWHRTGDAAYLDHQGYLYLVGRLRQSFVHNGQRTMVFPIEQKLQEIDGVLIGTILSIDDRVVIVVELAMWEEALDIISKRIREQGIMYDEIISIPKIPRDPRHHSKIDYDRLRERVERGMKRG